MTTNINSASPQLTPASLSTTDPSSKNVEACLTVYNVNLKTGLTEEEVFRR